MNSGSRQSDSRKKLMYQGSCFGHMACCGRRSKEGENARTVHRPRKARGNPSARELFHSPHAFTHSEDLQWSAMKQKSKGRTLGSGALFLLGVKCQDTVSVSSLMWCYPQGKHLMPRSVELILIVLLEHHLLSSKAICRGWGGEWVRQLVTSWQPQSDPLLFLHQHKLLHRLLPLEQVTRAQVCQCGDCHSPGQRISTLGEALV